jgi:lipoyl(octanoyl) transferase
MGPGEIEWRRSDAPVSYEAAVAAMEERIAAIREGRTPELVWLLEHPPIYTAGTSARPADLLDPARLPVYRSGRGGQYTYHGPGQRVAYVMLDLNRPDLGRNRRDVRCHVWRLEEWIIATLAHFNIKGERRDGRVGVWVVGADGAREDKIAAIGVRVRHWVSYHGVALNVDPDLDQFAVRHQRKRTRRHLAGGARRRRVDDRGRCRAARYLRRGVRRGACLRDLTRIAAYQEHAPLAPV